MLKNSFEKLSLKDKIFLYIIVVIGFLLLFIGLEKFLLVHPKQKQLQLNKPLTTQSLSDRIVRKDDKTILKFIEKELAKGDLFIDSITTTKETISLEIKGSFVPIMSILHQLETHLIIEELYFSKSKLKNGTVQIKVVFLNNYFTNQNKIVDKIKTIINPYQNKSTTTIIKKQQQIKPILVDAIVRDEVLIEGLWYKKDDSYLNYKITKIDQTFIKLVNKETNKLKIIKVENE